MKELSAIEQLESVKLIMETLGYGFDLTVGEAFSIFRAIDREIQEEMRCNILNRDHNMSPGSVEI